VSVGIQRLREDSEALREGARRKGEDPALVDAALATEERRRAVQGETEGLRAERKEASREMEQLVRSVTPL